MLNATECVTTVQKGEEQVGSRGPCATCEMIYNRTSSGVNGGKKGTLPVISTIYHYEYENDVKTQKDQPVKDAAVRALAESRVMLCRNCGLPFECEKC